MTAPGGASRVPPGTLRIGEQGAQVLCGNIPTANATLFVIDEVLRPG